MQRGAAEPLGIGLLGGLAGLLAMRYTMKATRRFVSAPHPLTPRDHPSMSLVGRNHREGEPATEALASAGFTLAGKMPALHA